MDITKLGKAFGATALVAISAVSLAGCGGTPPAPEQQAAAAEAGLGNATLFPSRCEVAAYVGGENTVYNFKYGAVLLTRGIGSSSSGYTISFNDIAAPATQSQIREAHSLLPASANCPAPVFATALAPAAPSA